METAAKCTLSRISPFDAVQTPDFAATLMIANARMREHPLGALL
jgi:hypothetical protein